MNFTYKNYSPVLSLLLLFSVLLLSCEPCAISLETVRVTCSTDSMDKFPLKSFNVTFGSTSKVPSSL